MQGLRDEYDLAFGIGAGCHCSMALRRAGMQYASFPLDWIFATDIQKNVDAFMDGFSTFVNKEDLVLERKNPANACDMYYNSRNGFGFFHDFPSGVPLEKSWQPVWEKYQRRAKRLFGLLTAGRSVLVVFVDAPACAVTDDKCLCDAFQRMQTAYPRVHFDLLCFSPSDAKFEVFKVSDHIYRACCDYRVNVEGSEEYSDPRVIAKCLRKMVRKVRDYRTDEERSEYARARRKKRFELHNARNWPEYFINRITWKLYVHFRNVVERRGIKGAG